MAQRTNTKNILMAINIIALLGLGGLSFYLYTENNDLNEQITLTTEEKNRRLIEEVNQVFNLPDEEPVVAIVTDPEEFKTQYPTFTDAIEGDYLLFFKENGGFTTIGGGVGVKLDRFHGGSPDKDETMGLSLGKTLRIEGVRCDLTLSWH